MYDTSRGIGIICLGLLHKQSANQTIDALQRVLNISTVYLTGCGSALHRRQGLAQIALAWVLQKGKVTSALIDASKVS